MIDLPGPVEMKYEFGRKLMELSEKYYMDTQIASDPETDDSATIEYEFNNFESVEEAMVYNLYNPVHVVSPKLLNDNQDATSVIENEIVQCNRVAFVDDFNVVTNEFNYLKKHYPSINFVISKDVFYPSQKVWSFAPNSGPKIVDNFQALISSGIYEKISQYFTLRDYRNRLNFTVNQTNNIIRSYVQPLNLEGLVQTIFYIYFILIAFSLVVLIVELIRDNFKLIFNLMSKCFAVFLLPVKSQGYCRK